MNGLYIESVRLNYDKVKQTSLDKYPLNIKCMKNLDKIEFKNRVTFLVGENGIGKSTFIEALALKVGLNPEGGTQNTTFSTYDDYSELEKYLWVSKFGIPKTKFFLRAESFYNVASAIDRDYLADLKYQYGGSLHECSHGESFIQLVKNRFTDHGLYILDEPEAALSPTRQMTLLKYIDLLAKEGSQFIIATHSPILIAYRDGIILDLNNNFKETKYEDTQIYNTYMQFINKPEKMQEILLDGIDEID